MQVYCIHPCYKSLSNFSPPCVNTYNLYCILVEIYYSIRSLSILNTIRPRVDHKYFTFFEYLLIKVFYDRCARNILISTHHAETYEILGQVHIMIQKINPYLLSYPASHFVKGSSYMVSYRVTYRVTRYGQIS